MQTDKMVRLRLWFAPLILLCALAIDPDDHGGDGDGDDDQRGARGLPRRHNSYTVDARLQHVIDCQNAIRDGRIPDAATYARHYRLSITSLRRWISNHEVLAEQAENDHHRRRVRRGLQTMGDAGQR